MLTIKIEQPLANLLCSGILDVLRLEAPLPKRDYPCRVLVYSSSNKMGDEDLSVYSRFACATALYNSLGAFDGARNFPSASIVGAVTIEPTQQTGWCRTFKCSHQILFEKPIPFQDLGKKFFDFTDDIILPVAVEIPSLKRRGSEIIISGSKQLFKSAIKNNRGFGIDIPFNRYIN